MCMCIILTHGQLIVGVVFLHTVFWAYLTNGGGWNFVLPRMAVCGITYAASWRVQGRFYGLDPNGLWKTSRDSKIR